MTNEKRHTAEPYERRYESEHVPSCKNCHIERTYPDADTQWEMGGRAAIHHIVFCPLHSSAQGLLEAAKSALDAPGLHSGKKEDESAAAYLRNAISRAEEVLK